MSSTESRTSPSRREVLVYAALGGVSSASYFIICHSASGATPVLMPAWVPFLPSLAIPYLLQLVVSFFLVFLLGSKALRRACMSAYFASYAVTCLVWLSVPTIMVRPPLPEGWWNWPYRTMVGLDLPVSILPAGHILMPVIVCWAFALERPRSLWWLVPCELLGTVAIVTTWQHRPVDVAIGAVNAVAFGLLFGMGGWRKRRGRGSSR